MKAFYILLLLIFVYDSTLSQSRITGTVVDTKGEVIAGANVYLLNTYDGASTDKDGRFDFMTDEQGEQTLVAAFIGYKTASQLVTISQQPVNVTLTLHEAINQLEAVTINAGAFTASDDSRRTVFRAIDIATTAGATADIAAALNTLPGTQKVGESGRLFVRGGDGNETRTFIDGLVVLEAYGPAAPNTPSRGRFLPFMFKGTSFSTGGYSAEYGQALSSALVLDSRDEAPLKRTDIGLLSVGGDVAHTQVWQDGSLAGKVQYTNLRPYMGLINQEIDWKNAPTSIEGVAAFRQRLGKSGMVKVYSNFNNATFSLYNHSIDHDNETSLLDFSNRYRYINGFYKNVIGTKWVARGGISYSYNENDALVGNTVNAVDLEKGVHGKSVFEGSISESIELKIGAEVISRYFKDEKAGAAFSVKNDFNETITALFSEADLFASNAFVTRVGTRLEYNTMVGAVGVDPRISLAYKTGNTSQVSIAYGKFRQSVNNRWLSINTALEQEKATHYILNYQLIDNNRTFRIESFYKRYDNLVKFVNGNSAVSRNNGNGYAKGIELFWRDNRSVRSLDYWVSYSLLDTRRDYLHFPYAATPSFASTHNFSLVGKYFVSQLKSQLGATFSFASGRPFNNPNTPEFNGGRTPSYQDLSFNWSYLPTPQLIVFFSCTNLLGRDNIFGYEYSNQRNENGFYNSRAIRQVAPRFLFLGIFLTLSKDKSVNQLPTL